MTGLPEFIMSQVPIALLALAVLLIAVIDRLFNKNAERISGVIAIAAAFLALLYQAYYCPLVLSRESGNLLFRGMAFNDGIAAFTELFILFSLLLAILLDYSDSGGRSRALLLLSAIGAMIVAEAANLITLVLGIIILTIPLYSLTSFNRQNPAVREASMKYLLIGFFATGILLFGSALYFAATGTLSLHDVVLETGGRFFFSIATGMIISSMLFLAGVLPFAAVNIDVSEGSSRVAGSLTAFGALASFAFLLRMFPNLLVGNVSSLMFSGLLVIALVTVIGANLLAVVQSDLRRLIACLAISSAGYTLLTALAFNSAAAPGVLVFLAAWCPVVLVAMYVTRYVKTDDGTPKLDDMTGAIYRSPVVSIAFALMLGSLAGLPLTIGFMGRIMILPPLIDEGLTGAAVVAMVSGLAGLYAVSRVIVRMFAVDKSDEDEDDEEVTEISVPGWPESIGLWIAITFTVIAGIIPAPFYYLAVLASGHL